MHLNLLAVDIPALDTVDQKTQAFLVSLNALIPWVVTNGVNLLAAILILLIGLWLSGKVSRIVTAVLGRTPQFDAMLRGFFASLARYAVLTLTVLAVLAQFGIQTASLVAVIGAAGLAIGLALQGTLSSLAAGVMLLIFRPFKIGDKVQVGGATGTVRDLSLFWTELISDDQIQIIIPNNSVWGQALRNMSVHPTPAHAGELRFRIPETSDLDSVAEAVRRIVAADPRIQPNPTVLFDRTGDSRALDVVVGFSTADDIVAAVKSDLIRAIHATALSTEPPAVPLSSPPAT
ncbi:mechanosensitive ion channel family protein [Nitrospirillum amazonense]|uniref:Small-conductance mechanosensitive channel n=1 Tax=Nitrospirillum amazonense TaxID=28077 RepID=A0A560JPK6_9PROT|nr:mechanosensitive ion channel domain-containing protein [Nitrospirillum amazonense]MDG3442420.1 mechanosensitive ion channel [Nitrospirillum amazonense]TWB73083.1 small conductance mechanosensitive channel [Nitrospirillum amazonense]